jgi:hypothetical protein
MQPKRPGHSFVHGSTCIGPAEDEACWEHTGLHLMHARQINDWFDAPSADLGAAYGTAKAGVGICSMGVMHPGLIMKCE